MEGNKEVQKIKTDMKEIREMLTEIKSDTAYLRDFMEKYAIPLPMAEKAEKEKNVVPTVSSVTKSAHKSLAKPKKIKL